VAYQPGDDSVPAESFGTCLEFNTDSKWFIILDGLFWGSGSPRYAPKLNVNVLVNQRLMLSDTL
jgi:hypothetical protein